MPIGAVGGSHCADFMDPLTPPAAQTHDLMGNLFKIRQSSWSDDLDGKVKSRLNHRFLKLGGGRIRVRPNSIPILGKSPQ